MKQGVIQYKESIRYVAIGLWLVAIGCWPREQAVGRESPLRGLPPLGGRWQCEALTNEGGVSYRKLEAGSLKLEAGSLKQGIVQYKASIRYVAIGLWLVAIGCWPRELEAGSSRN